mgnify:CR=1 FL=1
MHPLLPLSTHTQVAVAILIPSEVLTDLLLPEALPQWGIWGTAVIPFKVSKMPSVYSMPAKTQA